MGRPTNAPLSTCTTTRKAAALFNLSDTPAVVIFPTPGNLRFQTFISIPFLKVKRISLIKFSLNCSFFTFPFSAVIVFQKPFSSLIPYKYGNRCDSQMQNGQNRKKSYIHIQKHIKNIKTKM